jgi:5S rRNA maturation endonuclease (ribonuclease M5)
MNSSNRAMMRKEDYETYLELESVVQEMDDSVDAVVVEGTHDKAALVEMGITKEIAMYSSGFSYVNLVDYLRSRHKRVAILTDYDRAGKKFNKKLTARLECEGVKVERMYREEIGRILGIRGMKSIESINSFRNKVFASQKL